MTDLAKLAVNEDGFAFDPLTGDSFTLNPTAQRLVERLIRFTGMSELVAQHARDFGLSLAEAERDITEFIQQLAQLGLQMPGERS